MGDIFERKCKFILVLFFHYVTELKCVLQVFFDTYQILHSTFFKRMSWNTIISNSSNKSLLGTKM